MMRHTSRSASASSSWFPVFLCVLTTLLLSTFSLVNAVTLPGHLPSSSRLEARTNVERRTASKSDNKGLSTAAKALIAVCWTFAFVAGLCLWALIDIWKRGRFGRWVRPSDPPPSTKSEFDDSISYCGEAQRIRSVTGRPPRSLLASERGCSRDDLTRVDSKLDAIPVLTKESRWFRRPNPVDRSWAELEAHGLGVDYTIQRSLDVTTYPLPLGSPTGTMTTSDRRRVSTISRARVSWIWPVSEPATSILEPPSRSGTISSASVAHGHPNRMTISSTMASLGHRWSLLPQPRIEPEGELSLSTSTLVHLPATSSLVAGEGDSSPGQRPILRIQTMFPGQVPPEALAPPRPLRIDPRKSRMLGPRDRRSRA